MSTKRLRILNRPDDISSLRYAVVSSDIRDQEGFERMRRPSTRFADTRASAFIGLVLALSAISPAHADGPLGLYVGATVGRGQEEANLAVIPYNNRLPFDVGHTAFGAVLGVRPMLHVGAEIGYIDFGQHADSLYNNAISGNLSLKADTAFAVFYLPLSDMELYGKVGVARLQSSANATENVSVAVCPPNRSSRIRARF
jgi:hypothetical protein